MNAVFRFLTILPVLVLTVTAHAGVEQEKTKCLCDGSGKVQKFAIRDRYLEGGYLEAF